MVNLFKILIDPPGHSRGIFYLRLFAISTFLFLSARGSSQPKLKVTEAKKNFGIVEKGTIVKNEFEITNVGNEPLLITDAEVTCSCTEVDYPSKPIMPGEKVIVVANFDTKSAYGRQDRIVTLSSNDPKGETKLRFKGIVSNK